MEFIPMLVLMATVKKSMDLYKMAKAGNWTGVITQLLAWAVAIGLVFLFAASGFAPALTFGGLALVGAGWATKVLIGFAVGSAAGIAADLLPKKGAEKEPDGTGPATD